MAIVRRVLPPLVALLLVLGVWEVLVRALGVATYLLPPPSEIAGAGFHDRAALGSAMLVTATSALIGFALSTVFGIMGGLLLASSRLLERALYPYALFLQTVPIVAIAPLLVLWFGAGWKAVAVSAFIVSVFPVVANTLAGVRGVEPALRDLFRLHRASRAATLWKLELPAALPQIVTGLRVAAGLAVIGAIVGEFVAGFSEGAAGLGITVLSAYRQLRTDLLFAAVFSAAVLGLMLFAVINWTGQRLLRRWHASAKEAS